MIHKEHLIRPAPLHILSLGRHSNIPEMIIVGSNSQWANIDWPAANRVIYIPVNIPSHFTVARFISTGDATGNVNLGLYTFSGNLLISTGSTARVTGVHYIGVTDQSFPPGHYYLAMANSLATSTPRAVNFDQLSETRACGALQEDLGSLVLPSTMTPVAYTGMTGGTAALPHFGFTQSNTL